MNIYTRVKLICTYNTQTIHVIHTKILQRTANMHSSVVPGKTQLLTLLIFNQHYISMVRVILFTIELSFSYNEIILF